MKKLMTLFAFALVAFTANAQSTLKGDVNGDGEVNVTDVTMIVEYVMGQHNSSFIVANADVNGDGSITVTDVAEAVNIILDGNQDEQQTPDNNIDLFVGQQKTVDYYKDSYLVSNSNPDVATVEIQDGLLTFTGISKGRTTITLAIIFYTNQTIEVRFIVRVSQLCLDNNHPHMINLGLPSGTKWACCNVGADKPEAYGGYYAWGETEEKEMYKDITYQYCTGEDKDGDGWYDSYYINQDIGYDIAGTEYDVAHVKWGGSWVMPSKEQIMEFLDYCSYEITQMNGVQCGQFTGPNGGTIFMPGAGYKTGWNDYGYKILKEGAGYYRSSTIYDRSLDDSRYTTVNENSETYFLSIGRIAHLTEVSRNRSYGYTVRPVSR